MMGSTASWEFVTKSRLLLLLRVWLFLIYMIDKAYNYAFDIQYMDLPPLSDVFDREIFIIAAEGRIETNPTAGAA